MKPEASEQMANCKLLVLIEQGHGVAPVAQVRFKRAWYCVDA